MSEVEVVTFGCRLNIHESEVIKEQARASGLEDTIVFNTCAVTQEAMRQARQAIRKMHRSRPNARIVVTGCAAQVHPDVFADMPEVNLVLGNQEKTEKSSWEHLKMSAPLEKVSVNDIMQVKETASHFLEGFSAHSRAFVQIQNGCDHRCTFCIIPYGRGNSRSVGMGEVISQIAKLIERGYREVVLTGVDLTSWGKDLPLTPSLGHLIQKILKSLPTLERLRLSSLDSIEVDPLLFEIMVGESRVMPHFHLSLQAGDDLILKRMKRRHLRQDAIRFCHRVRSYRPEVVFGADLIAGFPTETEAQFQRSLDLVDECGLTFLHVFPFSAHEKTPASRMPQVEKSVIKARAQRLQEKGAHVLQDFLKNQLGKEVEILLEKPDYGRTPYSVGVRVPHFNGTCGARMFVRLSHVLKNGFLGEVLG